MNKPIKASAFMNLLGTKLNALPQNVRIKSIGTNQDNFIFICQDDTGREYKLYVRCEEMGYDS